MNGNEVKEKYLKYNLQSWSVQSTLNPKAIEKADNIYLWDYDGNRYTDMSAQLVNMNLEFLDLLNFLILMYIVKKLILPVKKRQVNIM